MKKIVAIVSVIIVAVIIWLWFAGYFKSVFVGIPPQAPEAQLGFGGSLYEKIAPENPVSKFPETNPFKDGINPFSGAYKNPFGQ